RLRVVAVDRVAAHVLDDAARGERVRGRRVRAVVADHLHADFQSPQGGVVERVDVKFFVPAVDEDVGRAVVGRGRLRKLEARGHADHDVARARLQGVAYEAAALRPPGVFEFLVQVFGQQFGDL